LRPAVEGRTLCRARHTPRRSRNGGGDAGEYLMSHAKRHTLE
jgi:hypothetical protein